jgi:hypothetical protein
MTPSKPVENIEKIAEKISTKKNCNSILTGEWRGPGRFHISNA